MKAKFIQFTSTRGSKETRKYSDYLKDKDYYDTQKDLVEFEADTHPYLVLTL